MDNGPAKLVNFAQNIQEYGEGVGDMFEISTIRREDYDFIKGKLVQNMFTWYDYIPGLQWLVI